MARNRVRTPGQVQSLIVRFGCPPLYWKTNVAWSHTRPLSEAPQGERFDSSVFRRPSEPLRLARGAGWPLKPPKRVRFPRPGPHRSEPEWAKSTEVHEHGRRPRAVHACVCRFESDRRHPHRAIVVEKEWGCTSLRSVVVTDTPSTSWTPYSSGRVPPMAPKTNGESHSRADGSQGPLRDARCLAAALQQARLRAGSVTRAEKECSPDVLPRDGKPGHSYSSASSSSSPGRKSDIHQCMPCA
jgi:hypothetical protein